MSDKWYLSKTYWGVIFGFASFVLANLGYTVSSEDGTLIVNNITTLCQALAGLIGVALVIYGRIKAGQEVKKLSLEVKKLSGPRPRV